MSAPPIDQAFGRTAAYYDQWMRQAIPCFDEIFATAVALVPFASDRVFRVLDLGAGTGLFSSFVAERFPKARFELWDLSADLLEMARERFAATPERFRLLRRDYRELEPTGAPFDLVISSLSIHHLEHDEKQALFAGIRSRLGPGGLFLNIDQVRGETPGLRKLYWDGWLAHVRRHCEDEQRIRDSIERRQSLDRDASLREQLDWLWKAGFEEVDCVYKHRFLALFHARREAMASGGADVGGSVD